MSELIHRHAGLLADALDWLDTPFMALWPTGHHPIRAEDCLSGSTYTLRAEIPGVDPENDIQVAVSGGILTITADRHGGTAAPHHSEFHYGTLTRSFRLPANADEQHIQASYGHGILEVAIGLKQGANAQGGRRIPVRTVHHIKPT
jgi:HSP20 family protein